MFGNMLTMSKLTNLQLDVQSLLLRKLQLVVSISEISSIALSIFKTSLFENYSTKIDKFSIASLYPLVIGLTGSHI